MTIGAAGGNTSAGSSSVNAWSNAWKSAGGNGGSGGGAGSSRSESGIIYLFPAYSGGTDGRGGQWETNSVYSPRAGTGQGTTTRAFGESDGTLYSSGGSGGNQSTAQSAGAANTGNGGNGGGWYTGNIASGGSGIAIIRLGN